MKESPALLSDEALLGLICEAQSTVQSLPPATSEIFDRVRRFNQLYGGLPIKPEGVGLLYQDSKTAETRFRAINPQLTVGRLAKSGRNPTGCDLAFDDDEMSRRHFQITLTDDFHILRDLQSRNGTSVNGSSHKIEETTLKAGDVIFAGRAIFVFTGTEISA